MSQRLQWETDGLDWPHRQSSSFVKAAGLRWHVQQFGAEHKHLPIALLLHGTGASTHSWRGLAPMLAPHFRLLSLDLPGHGFTDMPVGGVTSQQLSLPGMAQAISALLSVLEQSPALVIGHSAGAAIGVRMCLDSLIRPKLLFSINGAFLPLGGMAGQLFSPVARLMSALPFVPQVFSWRAADPAVLQRLMDSTGSRLDATGMALYGKLVSNPGHAAGALAMMANWDLPQLVQHMPRLKTPLCLVVGSQDQTISPHQASRVMAILQPSARRGMTTLPGLGHLAHEERPDLVAASVIEQFGAADSHFGEF
ncbi:MAG: alpha/beta fold hydrolase [Polaromonas sp.]|nr:alpha/beta fold hydrolase [Polaromonas sp.]